MDGQVELLRPQPFLDRDLNDCEKLCEVERGRQGRLSWLMVASSAGAAETFEQQRIARLGRMVPAHGQPVSRVVKRRPLRFGPAPPDLPD
jgi:hypothetical protein